MSFNYFEALSHVQTYSKFRPCPPKSLVQAILSFLQKGSGLQEKAVDIGCGSGQSTTILAPFFKQVVGVDPSEDIIKQANLQNHDSNVNYKVGSAEELPFESESVDLVTTGQSIHWYNTTKFYEEVNRILKKNGVLAVYGYSLPEPGVEGSSAPQIIRKYYEEVLSEYVLDGSRKVYLKNYTDPEFNHVPFVQDGLMTREEGFTTEMEVAVSDITGYISSWSGFQNYIKKEGEQVGEKLLKQFEEELSGAVGKTPDEPVTVRYRYFLLLGRKV